MHTAVRRAAAEMSTRAADSAELRLVVLGRTGEGKRSAVSSILGLPHSPQDDDVMQECSKHRGEAAGRRVTVVSSPSWFGSGCDPEERRRLISSFISLSSPGPHVFLLCVPVNQPADGESRALDVLSELFGPAAVATNAIVLFTHTEELEEHEQLAGYLATWRKDLLQLAGRCGGRYHTLEARGGEEEEEEEERKAVEELLEKVEQVARHCSCPLYQEAEERVRGRQAEIVRRRRGGEQEGDVTEEEMEAVREEAERSVGDFDVDVESIFPPSAPPRPPSFLWGLWEKLTGWLPRVLRREALLGALVGLFVGGPFGGMMGATVGSVATEVGRRRTQKLK